MGRSPLLARTSDWFRCSSIWQEFGGAGCGTRDVRMWEICRAELVIYQLIMGCREGKALLVVYFSGISILAKGCIKGGCMQPCVQSAFQLGNHNTDLDDLSVNSLKLKPIWAGKVVSKLAEH